VLFRIWQVFKVACQLFSFRLEIFQYKGCLLLTLDIDGTVFVVDVVPIAAPPSRLLSFCRELLRIDRFPPGCTFMKSRPENYNEENARPKPWGWEV
jgi:hypothetical protein